SEVPQRRALGASLAKAAYDRRLLDGLLANRGHADSDVRSSTAAAIGTLALTRRDVADGSFHPPLVVEVEPAFQAALAALRDPEASVRSSTMKALGGTLDTRVVEPLCA